MDVKKSIREWFTGPQDYDRGLELLQIISKKSKVIGKLSKGESKTRREKLVYELSKFIGLREIPKAGPEKRVKIAAGNTSEKGQKTKTGKQDEKFASRFNLIGKDETIDDYPEEIKKVINEYSSLYMQRGKLHRKMVTLGDSNDAEIVTQRKDLAEKIKTQSVRMEELFKDFSTYKTDGVISPGPNNDKNIKQTGNESVDELKKLKKNLQASLAKDRNQLKFQNKTKPVTGKENPMPDGPKRIRLEKRIKTKETEITAIDLKIAKLE